MIDILRIAKKNINKLNIGSGAFTGNVTQSLENNAQINGENTKLNPRNGSKNNSTEEPRLAEKLINKN